eukprot:m.591907 g.591907  ORF g.591907 m.591907 type:complete len:172 (-) comp22388_c0_seq1:2237-2752(-)
MEGTKFKQDALAAVAIDSQFNLESLVVSRGNVGSSATKHAGHRVLGMISETLSWTQSPGAPPSENARFTSSGQQHDSYSSDVWSDVQNTTLNLLANQVQPVATTTQDQKTSRADGGKEHTSYLDRVTAEFEDDLDKLRSDGHVDESNVNALVSVLMSGAELAQVSTQDVSL